MSASVLSLSVVVTKLTGTLYEQMCRKKLQTEMIRNDTDPTLKFNETDINSL
jgi:hypothetical protein